MINKVYIKEVRIARVFIQTTFKPKIPSFENYFILLKLFITSRITRFCKILSMNPLLIILVAILANLKFESNDKLIIHHIVCLIPIISHRPHYLFVVANSTTLSIRCGKRC
jgi:hypothetical protein